MFSGCSSVEEKKAAIRDDGQEVAYRRDYLEGMSVRAFQGLEVRSNPRVVDQGKHCAHIDSESQTSVEVLWRPKNKDLARGPS